MWVEIGNGFYRGLAGDGWFAGAADACWNWQRKTRHGVEDVKVAIVGIDQMTGIACPGRILSSRGGDQLGRTGGHVKNTDLELAANPRSKSDPLAIR